MFVDLEPWSVSGLCLLLHFQDLSPNGLIRCNKINHKHMYPLIAIEKLKYKILIGILYLKRNSKMLTVI